MPALKQQAEPNSPNNYPPRYPHPDLALIRSSLNHNLSLYPHPFPSPVCELDNSWDGSGTRLGRVLGRLLPPDHPMITGLGRLGRVFKGV